jgi:hypothetical protein
MVLHRVRQGDTLYSLSKCYGVPTQRIIDHPDNTFLRDSQRNEGILRPGDRVTIPDPQYKEIDCASEQRHRFQCRNQRCDLEVQLFREDEPRGGEPYLLRFDMVEFSGNLDDDGWLRVRIPADVQRGLLAIGEGDDIEEYPVQVGHIDPVDEIRGMQQRLRNLGFFPGDMDDRHSDILTMAIRSFQTKYGLETSGEMDEATRDRLIEVYGC